MCQAAPETAHFSVQISWPRWCGGRRSTLNARAQEVEKPARSGSMISLTPGMLAERCKAGHDRNFLWLDAAAGHESAHGTSRRFAMRRNPVTIGRRSGRRCRSRRCAERRCWRRRCIALSCVDYRKTALPPVLIGDARSAQNQNEIYERSSPEPPGRIWVRSALRRHPIVSASSTAKRDSMIPTIGTAGTRYRQTSRVWTPAAVMIEAAHITITMPARVTKSHCRRCTAVTVQNRTAITKAMDKALNR